MPDITSQLTQVERYVLEAIHRWEYVGMPICGGDHGPTVSPVPVYLIEATLRGDAITPDQIEAACRRLDKAGLLQAVEACIVLGDWQLAPDRIVRAERRENTVHISVNGGGIRSISGCTPECIGPAVCLTGDGIAAVRHLLDESSPEVRIRDFLSKAFDTRKNTETIKIPAQTLLEAIDKSPDEVGIHGDSSGVTTYIRDSLVPTIPEASECFVVKGRKVRFIRELLKAPK